MGLYYKDIINDPDCNMIDHLKTNPHNWPEDFKLENGIYENKCIFCGEIFTGHKRRNECRVCAKGGA